MTLPGFESIPATSAGSSFIVSPWKAVLHTTEGDSLDGAVSAYRATTSWPHFTVDPVSARRAQHYDLNVSSRALLHRSGDPETNRANAIQIEIVGHAADTPDWPKAWYVWLGSQVLAPIRVLCPFNLTAPTFVRYPDSYGFGAAQRFSWDQWASYSGIVGHEHVPGNDHGDPGLIDTTTVLGALDLTPGDDDDMTPDQAAQLARLENEVWNDPNSIVNRLGPALDLRVTADFENALRVMFGAAPDSTPAEFQAQVRKVLASGNFPP